jgi:hypothetical protein
MTDNRMRVVWYSLVAGALILGSTFYLSCKNRVPGEPAVSWTRTFGGTGYSTGNSVQQTADGGYIIAGFSSHDSGGPDALLVKTDASGNETWDKTFGGPGLDYGYSVRQTADGGYIIAGSTTSYGSGSDDVWLIKADASGSKIWDKTFGGANDDAGLAVQQTSDGGYIITGYTGASGSVPRDLWLIRTDASGSKIWDKTFGGAGHDQGNDVQPTADGGYIIVGSTTSFGAGAHDVWAIKTDASGNKAWDRTYGGSYDDYGASVQQTADGGYIFGGSGVVSGANGLDFWLIKTDPSGNTTWDRTFGGKDLDDGTWAQPTSDGGYIITGCTYSFGEGNTDVWLVKTDASGNKTWDITFGGKDYDEGSSVQQTADGGYILSGGTDSYGARNKQVWLIKTESDGD